MTPTDVADLLLLSIGLFGFWLLVYAPIPGGGDDE